MADAAVYGFLPWVRTGLASMAKTAPTQNFVNLGVSLTVNTTAAPPVSVRLFGPGQVTGIDPRAIVRMEPKPGAVSFEPNYFPAVEFATPDFPWMFSPAVPNGAALRPWLCLVCVKVQPGVALTPRGTALPLLQFSSPAVPVNELPNLDEITTWAHAQISGAAPTTDADVISALNDPDSGRISRLICPRKLDPNASYIACLVPTYNVGVQTGISPDLPANDSDLSPAWTATTAAPFALPVYASWTFSTGDAGDFASLVRQIRPPTAPLDVGLAPMDESAMGFGMPRFPSLSLSMEGALKAPQTTSTPWPAGVQAQVQTALTPLLSPPARTGADRHAAHLWDVARQAATQPTWLQDLNFDPRMRAAAGIAVNVVRERPGRLDRVGVGSVPTTAVSQPAAAPVSARAGHGAVDHGAPYQCPRRRGLVPAANTSTAHEGASQYRDAGDARVAPVNHTYCVGLDGARFPPPHPPSGSTGPPAVPGGGPALTDRRALERGDGRPARARRRGTANRARRHGAVGHGLHRHTTIAADDGGRGCRAGLDHDIDRGAGSRADAATTTAADDDHVEERSQFTGLAPHRRDQSASTARVPADLVAVHSDGAAIPRRGQHGDLVYLGTHGADR